MRNLVIAAEPQTYEASIQLNIRGIRDVLEDTNDGKATQVVTAQSYSVGPAHTTLQYNSGYIGVCVRPIAANPDQPFFINASFTATSFSGQKHYKTSSLSRTWDKEITGWRGFAKFLCTEDWKLWEEMRSDDGFALHVVVRSSPVSTVRSTAVLDVVHKAVKGKSTAPNINFTLFRRRLRSGELQGRQTIHADSDVLKDTCDILHGGSCTPRPKRFRSYVAREYA